MPTYILRGTYEFAADRKATPGADRPLYKVFTSTNDDEAKRWVKAFCENRKELTNVYLTEEGGRNIPLEDWRGI